MATSNARAGDASGDAPSELRRLAHDLVNRLTALEGFAGLLVGGHEADEVGDELRSELLERVVANAQSIAELVQEVVAVVPTVEAPPLPSDPPAQARRHLYPVEEIGAQVRESWALLGLQEERPGTVLVVEDDPDQQLLIQTALSGVGYEVVLSDDGADVIDRLAGVDLVVLDYNLPGRSGLEILRDITRHDRTPVVMATGAGSEEAAVAAMRAGAIDYIRKGSGYLDALPGVVERALRQSRVERHAEDLASQLESEKEKRAADVDRERRALARAQAVAQLGSWEWTPTAEAMSWSDQLHCLLRLDHDTTEPSISVLLDAVHPDDRSVFRRVIERAIESGEHFDIQHRLAGPDVRWARTTGQVEGVDEGETPRVLGTMQDITGAVRAERKFQDLLEAAPDGIVVVDTEGVIRLVNRQTEALLGYDRDDLIGTPITLLLPEDSAASYLELHADHLASPGRGRMPAGVELTVRCKDGDERPVDVSLSPIETEGGRLVCASIRDITERKAAAAALAHQATHDSLTGLPNRTFLEQRLARSLASTEETGHRTAVLFLDIDRFKVINDGCGHSMGDRLLCLVADRLAAAVRDSDVVARFGGDEFVIVANRTDERFVTQVLAPRIVDALKVPFLLDNRELSVTVSIGIAVGGGETTAEKMLRDADAAMYHAKELGRDRWVLFDQSMYDRVTARVDTENALRRAVLADEIRVHYQPIVQVTSERVVGVEALVRWESAEQGMVFPDRFIPIAEESGLITEIGEFVLREACRDLAEWNAHRPGSVPLSVAVNISARQLLTPGLPLTVADALSSSGLAPELLSLEITESIFLGDIDASLGILEELKSLGVRLAVDDFGTGYSSLAYLTRFPVDTLKIDRSFVERIDGHGNEHRAVVSHCVDLAHAFGLVTVAEGVETDAQLTALRELGCAYAQGYLFARPVADLDGIADAEGRLVTMESGPLETTMASSATVRRRVLLVDDDDLHRSLMRMAVEDQGAFEVVAEASDGREAVAAARQLQPDLVLLDLAMPGMGGLEALPLIVAVAPDAEVVMVSALDSARFEAQTVEKGAKGLLPKGDDPWKTAQKLHALLEEER